MEQVVGMTLLLSMMIRTRVIIKAIQPSLNGNEYR